MVVKTVIRAVTSLSSRIMQTCLFERCVVGPCNHGMARPYVADRGTACDKEVSCE